jgi:hypothetical protein
MTAEWKESDRAGLEVNRAGGRVQRAEWNLMKLVEEVNLLVESRKDWKEVNKLIEEVQQKLVGRSPTGSGKINKLVEGVNEEGWWKVNRKSWWEVQRAGGRSP